MYNNFLQNRNNALSKWSEKKIDVAHEAHESFKIRNSSTLVN